MVHLELQDFKLHYPQSAFAGARRTSWKPSTVWITGPAALSRALECGDHVCWHCGAGIGRSLCCLHLYCLCLRRMPQLQDVQTPFARTFERSKRLSKAMPRRSDFVMSALASFVHSSKTDLQQTKTRQGSHQRVGSAESEPAGPEPQNRAVAARRGMRSNLIKAVLQQSWWSQENESRGETRLVAHSLPGQAAAVSPPPAHIPRHRGTRGIFLMAAILQWRALRVPGQSEDPCVKRVTRCQARSRPARTSSHSECVLRSAGEVNEEALPMGFGLDISAANAMSACTRSGYRNIPHRCNVDQTRKRETIFQTHCGIPHESNCW